ncbi:uncharacterized protein LOC133190719 [Saccostrea echinata]|uniref:uncharacterized protein LOC133190719 n=1 Tax=Saccostrea echinata TaxID=191078 RepID=UPI002A80275F|nr:uncharacterized protein LOC133190719 [Saccostrea echinata]
MSFLSQNMKITIKNVALNKNATLTSTAKDTSSVKLARYAVDGDIYTEAKTMPQNNPTMTIHLEEITTIKYMEIHLLLEESSSYKVFVVNVSRPEYTENTLCSNIANPPTMYHVWNITCTGDRSLTGNQVSLKDRQNWEHYPFSKFLYFVVAKERTATFVIECAVTVLTHLAMDTRVFVKKDVWMRVGLVFCVIVTPDVKMDAE